MLLDNIITSSAPIFKTFFKSARIYVIRFTTQELPPQFRYKARVQVSHATSRGQFCRRAAGDRISKKLYQYRKKQYNEDMIQKNERRGYASDLSDSQWAIIEPLFPPAGNRSQWEKRELVDAVLYFVENGCKWRNLPHDFPLYTTVANFYYAAIRSGLWEKSARRWWNGFVKKKVKQKGMKKVSGPAPMNREVKI